MYQHFKSIKYICINISETINVCLSTFQNIITSIKIYWKTFYLRQQDFTFWWAGFRCIILHLKKLNFIFLCLELLHCRVLTVNSGFVFGGLVPCPYGHIPGTFLYVCKGYSSRTYLPNSFPKNSVKSLSLIYI